MPRAAAAEMVSRICRSAPRRCALRSAASASSAPLSRSTEDSRHTRGAEGAEGASPFLRAAGREGSGQDGSFVRCNMHRSCDNTMAKLGQPNGKHQLLP